ncbi:MAG: FAD-dependent monooxygenase [Alphaproteobacteria bacterium]|nr:FAD-dependent monooxygenase [Alphaproteobacteria bacterium]
MAKHKERVLIAGAGPVGMVAAVRLSQAGIPVTLFEKEDRLLDDPRAATTHPATLEMLDEIGMAAEAERQGLVCHEFYFWDRPTGEIVAKFDHRLLANETKFPYVVQCEQYKLAKIALAMLQDYPDTDVRFSHEVTGVIQDADGVRVSVEGPNGPEEIRGRYLIGCDGGRSTIRKSTGIGFEGFTYEERFVVLSTPFDFEAERGCCYRNYYADPDEWCNLFKVSHNGPPGLWRAVFPCDVALSDDAALSDEAVQARMHKFFPKRGDYDIVHRNIYSINQRVASTFRLGRILLAGDSAHLNNSIGGMGLNGGIHDAMNATEKLVRVWRDEADDGLLDVYDVQRRTTTHEFTQAQTIANKKRLEAKDPETRAKNLQALRDTAADPERAKAFLMGTSMLSAVRRAATLR